MSLLLNPRGSSSPELSDSDELTSFSSLYCDEDRLEEAGEGEVLDPLLDRVPISAAEDDDDELCSLFLKEQTVDRQKSAVTVGSSRSTRRRKAVEWMVKVNTHYGFSTLTAVLAIDYLDRFISSGRCYPDKPWTIQLVAVACLSLAAKVEETDVPLLLDLQVEDAMYVFEAKTIQRMELLVLSELKWKMHPVTPISFMDYIVERFHLKNGDAQFEFLTRCHRLLLCLLSDARSVRYRPSVLATATVMNVIDQVEHFNSIIDSQTQLLSSLNISQEKVQECYEVIMEVVARRNKRKYSSSSYEEEDDKFLPSSPSEVIDAAANNNTDASFSCDSSSSSSNQSFSTFPSSQKKKKKKSRTQEKEEDQWVLVGFVGTPN